MYEYLLALFLATAPVSGDCVGIDRPIAVPTTSGVVYHMTDTTRWCTQKQSPNAYAAGGRGPVSSTGGVDGGDTSGSASSY